MIRLLISDVDGTLVDRDKHLSLGTVAAVARLRDGRSGRTRFSGRKPCITQSQAAIRSSRTLSMLNVGQGTIISIGLALVMVLLVLTGGTLGYVVTDYKAMRDLRHDLEKFHGKKDATAVNTVWPYLSDQDKAIRYAARTALEFQDVNSWRERALNEIDPRKAIRALLQDPHEGRVSTGRRPRPH